MLLHLFIYFATSLKHDDSNIVGSALEVLINLLSDDTFFSFVLPVFDDKLFSPLMDICLPLPNSPRRPKIATQISAVSALSCYVERFKQTPFKIVEIEKEGI